MRVWKAPIESGKPIPLVDQFSQAPKVSPDGKFILYEYWERHTEPAAGVAMRMGATGNRWSAQADDAF